MATPPRVASTDAAPSGEGAPSQARRIADVVLRAYKTQYGRGPESIKAHLHGDSVLVLARGGFSIVEESLREGGQADAVRDQRRVFADMIAPTLSTTVADVIDREVVAVLADTSQDPDLSAIVLVLGPAAT